MKISYPKQAVFKEIERTFLKGGLFDGTMGVQMSVGPDVADGVSLGDSFAHVVRAVLEVELPRMMPIVRVTGALERVEERSLTALLKALVHYGRKVQVVVQDPGGWPEWLQYATWTIVRTTKPFVLWPANEIWYKPDGSQDGPIEDIVLPPGNRPAQQFMYLDRTLSVERTEAFMLASQYSWALL